MLKLDYTFMMADAVGSKLGVEDTELEQAAPRVEKVHEQLETSREKGELPFYDLPFQDGVEDIVDLADELADRFDDLVVLGIGGSALGTIAVARALLPLHHNRLDRRMRRERPRLHVLDNVDPEGIRATFELLDPGRTGFCVISKSGTTVETMSQFLVARDWVRQSAGDRFRDHFILITDPEKGVLRQLAREQDYRTADIPTGVGGRFSVFTPVGLLPLAVAGVDVRELLSGAAELYPHVTNSDLYSNPAYLNGLLQYLAYGKGASISVMMPYSDRLSEVAEWYRQLWAESLGKKTNIHGDIVHVGPTPVKALGATDQHSQLQLYMEGPFDKVITFLAPDKRESLPIPEAGDIPGLEYLAHKDLGDLLANEQKASAIALARAGRPNCTLRIPDVAARTVGALLYMLEVQTVFAGALFDVDPLDQPGVEDGKIITSAFMGRSGFESQLQEIGEWERHAKSKVLEVV